MKVTAAVNSAIDGHCFHSYFCRCNAGKDTWKSFSCQLHPNRKCDTIGIKSMTCNLAESPEKLSAVSVFLLPAQKSGPI